MIKTWVDRFYLAFAALAVLAEAFLAVARIPGFPTEGWWSVVGIAAMCSFLNFTIPVIALYTYLGPLAEWQYWAYQIMLPVTVLAVVAWGLKRGWRTKIVTMVMLTAPSTIMLF